jgi:hypothetical protein
MAWFILRTGSSIPNFRRSLSQIYGHTFPDLLQIIPKFARKFCRWAAPLSTLWGRCYQQNLLGNLLLWESRHTDRTVCNYSAARDPITVFPSWERRASARQSLADQLETRADGTR